MKIPLPFNIILNLKRRKRPRDCEAPNDYNCYKKTCDNCRYKKAKSSGCFTVIFLIIIVLYILSEIL